MNSSISSTWVQEASLLSRTPSAADMDRPDAQMPLKPASSTIFADMPSWASMRNSTSGDCSMARNFAVLLSGPGFEIGSDLDISTIVPQ